MPVEISKRKRFNVIKLMVMIIQVLSYTFLLGVLGVCGITVIYLAFCAIDWRKPPVSFDFTVSSQVKAGDNMDACFSNSVRYRSYTSKRDIFIVASDHRKYDYEEVSNDPGPAGPGEPNCLSLAVSKNMAPGEAKFKMILFFNRRGNILDNFMDYTIVTERKFTVLPSDKHSNSAD